MARKALMAVAALVALLSSPASASNFVQNGNFTGAVYANPPVGGPNAPALPFVFGNHTDLSGFGWSNTGSDLDYIAASGTPLLPHAPANPAGYVGNIYAADAAPDYSKGTYLSQTLSGLTVGQRYVISFLQAAGGYYTGADVTPWTNTAGWDVSLGGSLSFVGGVGGVLTGGVHQQSATMSIDAMTGTSPWQTQSLTFTALDTNELLSFFATGSGAPPFALLAGVSAQAAPVPEPSTWALMLLGFGLLGGLLRRRQGPEGRKVQRRKSDADLTLHGQSQIRA